VLMRRLMGSFQPGNWKNQEVQTVNGVIEWERGCRPVFVRSERGGGRMM